MLLFSFDYSLPLRKGYLQKSQPQRPKRIQKWSSPQRRSSPTLRQEVYSTLQPCCDPYCQSMGGVFERSSLACTLCCLLLVHTMPLYMRSLPQQHLRMRWQIVENCEYQKGFQVGLSMNKTIGFNITHKLRARFSAPQSSTNNEKIASTGMLSRLL